ncbi:MAG: hypothetical protein HQ557_03690 [Bacteroidetes bacterium]|nr:hypothetical protein [Bacteroidota bacterium]
MEDIRNRWHKEPGPRIEGSGDLDISKLQAPGIVRIPSGGYRLFYTAVGPAKPYPNCQGYILSAVSEDGLLFHKEPGIRLAPQPDLAHMSLRIIAPSVTQCDDGLWRMYFESRGSVDEPTVICSAVSTDMLHWEHEDGIRLQGFEGVRAPRYLRLADGRGRLYCIAAESDCGAKRTQVISAVAADGLNFVLESGCRLRDRQSPYDSMGITAAEVVQSGELGEICSWTMFYSAWQDVPQGTIVPMHPSQEDSLSDDFAAASIASDMAGYRSRIFRSYSKDGLKWEAGECVIEGVGYDSDDLDAVHAEDMSLIKIGAHRYRMYYASCDKHGIWRILSAVTE